MSHTFSRRQLLRTIGLATGGLLTAPLVGFDEHGKVLELPDFSERKKPKKAITAITLGAGNRGNVYGNFSAKYPEQLDVIGVAEPINIRNSRYCEKHNISKENSFTTWEHVFERPKFADAIIITTPDDLHYGPCMAALKKGYDILLEKPISPSEKECRDILSLAEKTGRIVAVCHVLRYAPYFIELRKMIQSGKIGELVSIQHFEPIQHIHMAHSFVRGNWHNSKETTPIILAKSCHDLDIIRWLVGKPCEKISAFGDLKWFRKSNQPEGATARCMNGCSVEKECPYSAKRIYLEKKEYTYVIDFPEGKYNDSETIKEFLNKSNYGRCVYDMENDQCDHYVANMQFQDGITVSFNMEAFTSYHGRRTRVMGSHGDIVGDMKSFTYTDFKTRKQTEWSMETDGHGGGDWNLVADWIQAIDQRNPDLLSSTISASVESHLMGFAAENSRKSGAIQSIVI